MVGPGPHQGIDNGAGIHPQKAPEPLLSNHVNDFPPANSFTAEEDVRRVLEEAGKKRIEQAQLKEEQTIAAAQQVQEKTLKDLLHEAGLKDKPVELNQIVHKLETPIAPKKSLFNFIKGAVGKFFDFSFLKKIFSSSKGRGPQASSASA